MFNFCASQKKSPFYSIPQDLFRGFLKKRIAIAGFNFIKQFCTEEMEARWWKETRVEIKTQIDKTGSETNSVS